MLGFSSQESLCGPGLQKRRPAWASASDNLSGHALLLLAIREPPKSHAVASPTRLKPRPIHMVRDLTLGSYPAWEPPLSGL